MAIINFYANLESGHLHDVSDAELDELAHVLAAYACDDLYRTYVLAAYVHNACWRYVLCVKCICVDDAMLMTMIVVRIVTR